MTYNLKAYSDNGKMIEFSIATGIVISDFPSMTSVVINQAASQGVSQIGTTVQGESVDGKVFPLKGSILGNSDYYRKQLIDVFVPMVGVTLVYNNTLEQRIFVRESPDISRHKTNAQFQISLYESYEMSEFIPQLRAMVTVWRRGKAKGWARKRGHIEPKQHWILQIVMIDLHGHKHWLNADRYGNARFSAVHMTSCF